MRQRTLAVAVVTAQLTMLLMQRVITVAALTLRQPAAVVAHQRRRKAAAIEKQQNLIIRLQVLAHLAQQRGRKTAFQLLSLEID